VAEGHATRSLFFIDAPPGGRVILERAAAAAATRSAQASPNADTQANEPAAAAARDEGQDEREPVRHGPRRRAAAVPAAQAAQRPRAVAEPAAPARSTEVKKSAQVQLIEARTPHVQVVE
jgi:hypothetical protein